LSLKKWAYIIDFKGVRVIPLNTGKPRTGRKRGEGKRKCYQPLPASPLEGEEV
jgi:hypothetical protein